MRGGAAFSNPVLACRSANEVSNPDRAVSDASAVLLTALALRCGEPFGRTYTEADSGLLVAGDANCITDHVCLLWYRDGRQISIFSAISIASSTSMPR